MDARPESPPERAPRPPAAAERGSPGPSLASFSAPRYWPTWAFIAVMRLTAALPWRLAIAVYGVCGRVIWYLLPRSRRVVVRNLEICFPELERRAALRLARRSFENVIISLAEIAIAWFGRTLPPVRIEGREHLDAALAAGKGVILFSGHFTTLELTGQFLKPLVPRFAFMFRQRSNPLLDAVQRRGRRRTADVSFANSDSRAMLRALRDNAVVWYAPDQAYTGPGAALLPFFGEPAMTNTATTRLAKISGAAVVPFQFLRLPDGSGYLLRFGARVTEIPSDDPIADTLRLMALLERSVRECPDQYLWTHRRFRSRGPDLPDVYARRAAPPPPRAAR